MKKSHRMYVESHQRKNATMYFVAESIRMAVRGFSGDYETHAYQATGAGHRFHSHGIMTQETLKPENRMEAVVVFSDQGTVETVSLHEWIGPRPTGSYVITANGWSRPVPNDAHITLNFSHDDDQMGSLVQAAMATAAIFAVETALEAGVIVARMWRMGMGITEWKTVDKMLRAQKVDMENIMREIKKSKVLPNGESASQKEIDGLQKEMDVFLQFMKNGTEEFSCREGFFDD